MVRSIVLQGVAAAICALATTIPIQAQCQTGQLCDVGQFAGPWDWNAQVCSSHDCPYVGPPVEFYHGAVIPRGMHAGKVVLLRVDTGPDCSSSGKLQTWLFNPSSPAILVHIQHETLVPAFMNCAGNTLDPRGRFVMVGGVPWSEPGGPLMPNKRVFRFDPTALGVVELQKFPYPPTGPTCSVAYIPAEPWTEINSLNKGRYYATAQTITRAPIDTPGCTAGIASAVIAIGGPPLPLSLPVQPLSEGNEVWELLDPITGSWACPLVPPEYPGSFPSQQIFQRKPDDEKPNPLLDSYPRSFPLSLQAQRQIFIAGDTRTNNKGKPAPSVYGATLSGKETWTMKIPYANLQDPQTEWELWRSDPLPIEHDYGNAVVLFRKVAFGGALIQNRVLLIAGGQYDHEGQSDVTGVTGAVREFIPGTDASSDLAIWRNKTPLVHPRYGSNSVLLPDGTILVVGGSSTPTIPGGPGNPTPVFEPEIYDPGPEPVSPGSTQLMAESNEATWGPATRTPRMYHSMAFLLPDGRVFIVSGRILQDAPTWSDSRLSGEIFSPPYLFEGDQPIARPSIDGVLLSNPSYQQLSSVGDPKTFEVDFTASDTIKMVSVIRMASVTHHFDGDQRFIELDFDVDTSGPGDPYLVVTAPREDMAPQGYYYLFILEEVEGRLIPSVAHILNFQ